MKFDKKYSKSCSFGKETSEDVNLSLKFCQIVVLRFSQYIFGAAKWSTVRYLF